MVQASVSHRVKLNAVEGARENSLYPYQILIPGLGYPSTESAVLPNGCDELLAAPLDENIELVIPRVKAEGDAGRENVPRS